MNIFYKLLIINNFYGTLYYKLEGGNVNFILFSNDLMSSKPLYKEITSGNSKGILTYKQTICKESWNFIKKLIIDYYDAMEIYVHENNQNVNNYKIYIYEMHDYKIMYILLQYGSYTRKNYLFLLCIFLKK